MKIRMKSNKKEEGIMLIVLCSIFIAVLTWILTYVIGMASINYIGLGLMAVPIGIIVGLMALGVVGIVKGAKLIKGDLKC